MNCRKSTFTNKPYGPRNELPEPPPECQNTSVLIVQKCKHEKRMPVVRLPCPRFIKSDEYAKQAEYGNCKVDQRVRKPRIYPTIIKNKEFNRIKEEENFKSLEETVEAMKRAEDEEEKVRLESVKRKQFFKDIDNKRLNRQMELEKNKVQDISEAKQEKAQILEKSFIAKYENEEEVKKANRIILNAKCSIIRRIQLDEKSQLKKEAKEEDMKCDTTMLEQSKGSLFDEEAKEKIAKEKAIENEKYLKKQLQDKYLEKQLEYERNIEEGKILAKAAEVRFSLNFCKYLL